MAPRLSVPCDWDGRTGEAGIPLPLGVVGHEGSTVIVVFNGLRQLRAR